MEEKAPNLQLQEPISPESLVPAMDFAFVWLIAGAVIVLIALAYFLTRKRKAALDPTAHRLAAYKIAKKSLDAVNAGNAREAAVQTSLIIRRFLSDAVGDPSLFETHEEFISRQDSLKKLKPEARDAASQGFSRLVKLKYAPEIPTEPPAVIVAEARELLEKLNGGFES